jgi:hypothetical protein
VREEESSRTSPQLPLELLSELHPPHSSDSDSCLHESWHFSAGGVFFLGLGGKDSGKRSGSAGELSPYRLHKFWVGIPDPSH